MSFLRSRRTSVVIFACLAFISLLAFQNCGQSVRLMGSSNPAQANSLNDMIRETEKEIKVTKAVMNGATRRDVYEIRKVANSNSGIDKKNLQIKLKRKKSYQKPKSQVVAKKTEKNLKARVANKNKKIATKQNQKNPKLKVALKTKKSLKSKAVAKKSSNNKKSKLAKKTSKKNQSKVLAKNTRKISN